MSRLEFYKTAANDHARKTYVDEKERESFEKGVKWAIQEMLYEVTNFRHPMCNDSKNAYLAKLTLSGIKAFCKKMLTEVPVFESKPWFGKLVGREGIERMQKFETEAEASAYVCGATHVKEISEISSEVGDDPLEDYQVTYDQLEPVDE